MADIPMNERNIVYFPMQSVQIDTDEQGNPIYDNAADAEILQKLRQREIKDGVYPDDSTYLQVMSNNDMTVTVKAGYAHIQGVQVWIKEDVILVVEDANVLVDRIDRVVLRLSLVDREVTLAIKKGDTSLTRIAGQTWELGLADLAAAKNNAVITQSEITDLRLNPSLCGIVSGLMQVDTKTIFNQYMDWWERQQDTIGYLTVDDYSSLLTTNKKVLGAINELSDEKINYVDIANVLNSTATNKPLSAAMGKALQDSKINYSDIANVLNSTAANKPLSAAMGKALQDNKINYTDVINDFSHTDTNKPISAAQGKWLYDNTLKRAGSQTLGGDLAIGGWLNAEQSRLKSTYIGTLDNQAFIAMNGIRTLGLSADCVEILNVARNGYSMLKCIETNYGSGLGIYNSGGILVLQGGLPNIYAMSDGGFVVTNSANNAYRPILASAFNVGSSYRFKDNINPFTDAASEKLLNIELKTFTYKKDYNDDGEKIHMGVIAEQIADLFPDAISLDENGEANAVDYSKLVIPCIGMIQQLNKRIAEYKKNSEKFDKIADLFVEKGLLTQTEIEL